MVFQRGLFSVQILKRFIWIAFFSILILLLWLHFKRMRDADKKQRVRTRNSHLAIRRSNASLVPNYQQPINISRTTLSPISAVGTNETVINLEIEDASSNDSSAHSESDIPTPPAPCQSLEDLPPHYEVPPSYHECVQQEK